MSEYSKNGNQASKSAEQHNSQLNAQLAFTDGPRSDRQSPVAGHIAAAKRRRERQASRHSYSWQADPLPAVRTVDKQPQKRYKDNRRRDMLPIAGYLASYLPLQRLQRQYKSLAAAPVQVHLAAVLEHIQGLVNEAPSHDARQLLQLRYLEGLTSDDAGARLGYSARQIDRLINSALAEVEERLEKQAEVEPRLCAVAEREG